MYENLAMWLIQILVAIFLSPFGFGFGICYSCGTEGVIHPQSYPTGTYELCDYCAGYHEATDGIWLLWE